LEFRSSGSLESRPWPMDRVSDYWLKSLRHPFVVWSGYSCGQPQYDSARYSRPYLEPTTVCNSPMARRVSKELVSFRVCSMLVIQYEKFWAFQTRFSAVSE